MRKILSMAVVVMALSLASCGGGHDSGDDTGTATHMDSTTLNGTAPVQYGGNDPAAQSGGVIQDHSDTGVRPGNGTAADSNTNRLP
jgi:hypothetical protein